MFRKKKGQGLQIPQLCAWISEIWDRVSFWKTQYLATQTVQRLLRLPQSLVYIIVATQIQLGFSSSSFI